MIIVDDDDDDNDNNDDDDDTIFCIPGISIRHGNHGQEVGHDHKTDVVDIFQGPIRPF